MIPKIIHFVWIGSEMPDWAARNVNEFRRLNPEHEILIHTDDRPPERYESVWSQGDHPSTRSDLIRLALLREHGGWYFDVDYWPLRPVEDIERAFLLDGSRLFAGRMNNPRINNGVLACGPDCAALDVLDSYILAGGMKHGNSERTKYGPPILTKLAETRPDLVRIADWPWLNGVRDIHAAKVWRKLLAGGEPELMLTWAPTGGQLPYAFHMWAHTHGNSLCNTTPVGPTAIICGKRAGDDDSDRPYQSLKCAAESLGYTATVAPWDQAPIGKAEELPDVAIVWNGLKGAHGQNADDARKAGATVLLMEYGFFDRNNYFQIDHAGFLHRASWGSRVADPAPPEGAEKLARFCSAVTPQRTKRDGYILVLGQVGGDTQLLDSELNGPMPLQRAVRSALPDKTTAYFRPHPQSSRVKHQKHKIILPEMPGQQNEAADYAKTNHGTGLAEALAGARFVVTINSNAIVEALITGVPVLAFGPSLAINAGAVHATSLATIRDDMAEMCDGWTAPDDNVVNYLQWLAARQWNVQEFAEPELLRRLLADAGVTR